VFEGASVEQKLFAIMKGNFSALAVNRIREKSKNDPPQSVGTLTQIFFLLSTYELWIFVCHAALLVVVCSLVYLLLRILKFILFIYLFIFF
jgi:hypothetical protein